MGAHRAPDEVGFAGVGDWVSAAAGDVLSVSEGGVGAEELR
jgi:hypothetical protein